MKVMDDWYIKYQNADKADLLKRVIELEKESKQLKEQNKELVPEELAKENDKLKRQLEQLNVQQQIAQVEIKWEKK